MLIGRWRWLLAVLLLANVAASAGCTPSISETTNAAPVVPMRSLATWALEQARLWGDSHPVDARVAVDVARHLYVIEMSGSFHCSIQRCAISAGPGTAASGSIGPLPYLIIDTQIPHAPPAQGVSLNVTRRAKPLASLGRVYNLQPYIEHAEAHR